jgi:hypothetical protein
VRVYDPKETLWKAVGTGAGVLAAALARRMLMAGWQKTKKADPPTNPASPETKWSEALAWAVLTGVMIGVARLIATRGAAEGWRRATGLYPPGLEEVT